MKCLLVVFTGILHHQISSGLKWLHDNIKDVLVSVRTMRRGCDHIQFLHRQMAVTEVVYRDMLLNIEVPDRKIDSGEFYKTTIGESNQIYYFNKKGKRLYAAHDAQVPVQGKAP